MIENDFFIHVWMMRFWCSAISGRRWRHETHPSPSPFPPPLYPLLLSAIFFLLPILPTFFLLIILLSYLFSSSSLLPLSFTSSPISYRFSSFLFFFSLLFFPFSFILPFYFFSFPSIFSPLPILPSPPPPSPSSSRPSPSSSASPTSLFLHISPHPSSTSSTSAFYNYPRRNYRNPRDNISQRLKDELFIGKRNTALALRVTYDSGEGRGHRMKS